ncbi:MAG: hypothetical protein ABI955_08430 [Nitrospirota bacterium]
MWGFGLIVQNLFENGDHVWGSHGTEWFSGPILRAKSGILNSKIAKTINHHPFARRRKFGGVAIQNETKWISANQRCGFLLVQAGQPSENATQLG